MSQGGEERAREGNMPGRGRGERAREGEGGGERAREGEGGNVPGGVGELISYLPGVDAQVEVGDLVIEVHKWTRSSEEGKATTGVK